MNSIEYYNLLSVISLVMFIILTVMAIIMWFKLDVMHYFAVLTGSEAKRSIDKIRKDAASGEVQQDRRRKNKAVVSWNTSDSLDNSPASISHKLAAVANTGAQATGFDPDKTTVLGQPDPYATMVLNQLDKAPVYSKPVAAAPIVKPQEAPAAAKTPEPAPAFDFVVEKEIKNSADTQS